MIEDLNGVIAKHVRVLKCPDIFHNRLYSKIYSGRRHNGILLFFHLVIMRCFLLTTIVTLIALQILRLLGAGLLFKEFIYFFIAAILEEQSRWLYSIYSDFRNPVKTQIQFAVLIIIIETFGNYNYHEHAQIWSYLVVRFGSMLVHCLNGVLCVTSLCIAYDKKLVIFCIAVAFHVFMNMFGIKLLANLILRI